MWADAGKLLPLPKSADIPPAVSNLQSNTIQLHHIVVLSRTRDTYVVDATRLVPRGGVKGSSADGLSTKNSFFARRGRGNASDAFSYRGPSGGLIAVGVQPAATTERMAQCR